MGYSFLNEIIIYPKMVIIKEKTKNEVWKTNNGGFDGSQPFPQSTSWDPNFAIVWPHMWIWCLDVHAKVWKARDFPLLHNN